MYHLPQLLSLTATTNQLCKEQAWWLNLSSRRASQVVSTRYGIARALRYTGRNVRTCSSEVIFPEPHTRRKKVHTTYRRLIYDTSHDKRGQHTASSTIKLLQCCRSSVAGGRDRRSETGHTETGIAVKIQNETTTTKSAYLRNKCISHVL